MGPKLHGLEALSSLRKLDLSRNRIADCSGVETLCALEDLNLDGNVIQEIPREVGTLKVRLYKLNAV